jgi:AraC-like DNA-binding protein
MTEVWFGTFRNLIRDAYQPFDEVAELVRCFGEVALAATDATSGEIAVRSPEDEAHLRVCLGADKPGKPVPGNLSFPIRYQACDLGLLVIDSPALRLGEMGTRACEWVAKNLAYHLKRHEIRRLALEREGRSVSFIGTSEPLGRVDRFVEQASRSPLPALILGAPGSKTERVALALHLLGPTCEGRFVQVNSSILESDSFEMQMLGLLQRADGGTLLLAHLENLELRSQNLLCHILEIGPSRWASELWGRPVEVRFLATATLDIESRLRQGEIYAALLDQLDFLHLELEPLRARREDIPPLIEHYLRRHACEEVPGISSEVLNACIEYDWPGDVLELSRVVARLAVMAEGGCVLPSHLQTYFPKILREKKERQGASPSLQPTEFPPTFGEKLPDGLLAGLADCHPSIRRAVDHIVAHYKEKLSLEEVASNAFVSGSYLAHLFQQELGTSFTRLLTALRTEQARSLLLARPREPVGTIAADTGFSSLRHFEKTFKSIVGCTAREYRRFAGRPKVTRDGWPAADRLGGPAAPVDNRRAR